ncbi:MAG: hypothetical protein V1843_05070 [bacterium]
MKKNGFSVLELIMSMVILVLVFFPLLQAIAMGLASGSDTESETMALNIARQKVEETRNLSYASIASVTKVAHGTYPQYQYQITVTTPQTNLKQVTATTYWISPGGSELNVALSTYVANF